MISLLVFNLFKMLRFEAHLESIWPSDKGRKFVFTYYLADDTVSIFEPVPPNAGRPGGRFLIRLGLKDLLASKLYALLYL